MRFRNSVAVVEKSLSLRIFLQEILQLFSYRAESVKVSIICISLRSYIFIRQMTAGIKAFST